MPPHREVTWTTVVHAAPPARREPRVADSPDEPLLSVRELDLAFGGIRVLDHVDLDLAPGVVCGLVGPNGAGKTSLFNCISGLYRASGGSIRFDGQELLGAAAYKMPGYGVMRTFQHPSLTPTASVLDNVLVGGHTRTRGGAVAAAFRAPFVRRDEARLLARARELLDYLGLAAVAGDAAGSLPFGTQKRIEICRALLAEPKLLMLDEPACGVAHGEVTELGETIQRIRSDFGLTVLLVEHHMGLVSAVTDRVVVLVEGRVVVEGTAAEVQRHPTVIEAYLGRAA